MYKNDCVFSLKTNYGRGWVCSLCGKGCHTIDENECKKLKDEEYKRRHIN